MTGKTDTQAKRQSAFDDLGFSATVDALVSQTQQLYLADQVPWVVGYSGGKDSTAVLQRDRSAIGPGSTTYIAGTRTLEE